MTLRKQPQLQPQMRRRALLACLLSSVCFGLAAQTKLLELNQASRAELESLAGLGPSLVERLLTERAKAAFNDWPDLQKRVRGIGPATAKKLSAQGLRLNGQAYPD